MGEKTDKGKTLVSVLTEDTSEAERQQAIIKTLSVLNPDALFADGLGKALVGYAQIFNTYIAVYEKDKVIEVLMEDGLSMEEAVEYFDFNIGGSYNGENTPAYATLECFELGG